MLKYIIPSIMPSLSPKKAIKLPPEILDKLTGKYEAKEHGIVAPVFRERDKLYTRTSFWDKVELLPENETKFFGNSKNIRAFYNRIIYGHVIYSKQMIIFIVNSYIQIIKYIKNSYKF